jgi:hypothetical protein
MEEKEFFRLHVFSFLMVVILVLLFVSGMIINLFVTFPEIPQITLQSNQYFPLFNEYPVLLAHFLLGIILLIGALITLVMSYKAKQTKIIRISLIGFLSVIVALVSGFVFMQYTFSNSMYSFTMSLGFFFALIAFLVMFYETKIKQ